jgi:hypothetical protein
MVSRTMAGSLALNGDWDLGEDGWKAGMDDNLLWLSVLTQGRFTDVVTIEPGAPAEGSVYILAAAHATHPNQIAVYDEATWHYRTAQVGWRLFNITLGVFQQWNGTTWALDSAGLTAEDVRDIIGAALVSGTNVTITPNDGSDTITVDAAGGSTDEQIQDMIATFLLQGTNVTLTYNDAGNHLTIAASGGGGGGGGSWTHPDIAPPLAAWFGTTGNAPTLTDYTNGLGLQGAAGGTVLRYAVKAGLAADTTIVMRLEPDIIDSNSFIGFMARDSASGKCLVYGPVVVGGQNRLLLQAWTTVNAVSADLTSTIPQLPLGRSLWFKIVYTAATKNFAFYYSNNGKIWHIHSSNNAFLANPDQLGITVWSTAGAGDPPSGVFTYWTDGTNNGTPLVLSKP